jgi:DNA-binding winged helix-turn-helix (wHTH) protein/TolB-like protein/Flp pilus assembly protein TadD
MIAQSLPKSLKKRAENFRKFPKIPMNGESQLIISFAEFELDTAHRRLSRRGRTLPLYAKTFDLLAFLLENNGRLLTKDEILETVWAGQSVEESNLSVQISALRKVLGEKKKAPRFLVTVPGKGYKFVAEVQSGPERDEIVIEEQTVTHLVVESELEFSDEGSPAVAAPARLIDVAGRRVPPDASPLPARSSARPRGRHSRRIVLAAGLLLALLAALVFFNRPTPQKSPLARIGSIAVLPFKPLVAENRNEALEMGMADTLIAKLSGFREINIRPISAVRKYANLEQDAVAAGREQQVDAVLDGQIQKSEGKIRMTVSLIRVEDGATVWTSQFDEKMRDIFTVQDSISERVAGLLALKLSGAAKEQLARRDTENTEAYQLYLMGRYHLNRLTDDGFLKGRDYFQQAIERDPNYALAYAGTAEAYNMLSGWNALPPNVGYPKAREAALKALALDDNLTEAHTALGNVKFFHDWDWPGAEQEFRRAIEINPGNADARQAYSYYLSVMGRFDEALAEIGRAQELDPLSLAKIAGLGEILHYQRQPDRAIEQYRRAIEMEPNSGFTHWALGNVYVQKGMYDDAIAEYQKSIPLSGESPDESAALAYACALSGRKREALRIVDDLTRRAPPKHVSPTIIAFVYGGLNEKDRAFAWLDRAYQERDFLLVLLAVEPMFDPLRSDPRFAELARRVGLPQ